MVNRLLLLNIIKSLHKDCNSLAHNYWKKVISCIYRKMKSVAKTYLLLLLFSILYAVLSKLTYIM